MQVTTMLREVIYIMRVRIPIKILENNKEVLTSVVANRLLLQMSNLKACEDGYMLAVTKLIRIGLVDDEFNSQHIIFPVKFCCQIFTPVAGEVMTGIVHKISDGGVFLKSGPMNMIYLSSRLMPDYHYVPGETQRFIRDDLSKIEIDVVVRYVVFGVRWIDDKWREFRVLASIKADGLGPVSLNGLDGIDL
ncbi:hypothetical protein ACS0TY_014586 [Phlomoides rotata]